MQLHSSETFKDFYQTTRHYIPEDSTLHIPEETTNKNLFCMSPAIKSKVVARRSHYGLPG
jgi:hypothetical protein